MDSKKSSRSTNWESGEIFKLCEVWAEFNSRLNSCQVKTVIYDDMSKSLRAMGVIRTAIQIQRKLQLLKTEYRKKKPKKTGDTPCDWQYFDAVHKVLHCSHFFNKENANIQEAGIFDEIITRQADEENEEAVALDELLDGGDVLQDVASNSPVDASPQPFVTAERTVSESSRSSKIQKRKLKDDQSIQLEILDLLKKGREDDKAEMSEAAKSQKENTALLTSIANSLSQLVNASVNQPQQHFPHPSHFNLSQFYTTSHSPNYASQSASTSWASSSPRSNSRNSEASSPD